MLVNVIASLLAVRYCLTSYPLDSYSLGGKALQHQEASCEWGGRGLWLEDACYIWSQPKP